MDTKETPSEKLRGHAENVQEGASQIQQAIKREIDSLDDFEHLGHDISPIKEFKEGDRILAAEPTRELLGEINKGVDANQAGEQLLLHFDPPTSKDKSLFDKPQPLAMDSNLLELAETFPDRKEADAKLDKFLSEISSLTGPTEKELKENVKEKIDDVKSASQNFMDMERSGYTIKPTPVISSADLIEHYSDSDNEDDDFKPSNGNFPPKVTTSTTVDAFKDLEDFELPKPSIVEKTVEQPKTIDVIEPAPPVIKAKSPEVIKPTEREPKKILPDAVQSDFHPPEPVKIIPPQPAKITVEPEKLVEAPKKPPVTITEPKKIEKVEEVVVAKEQIKKAEPETKSKIEAVVKTEAEVMFCKMGLDAWFIPEKLNPKVADLIYWRDPKKSGPVFGGVLIVLLALTYFSLISVVAYLSLLALTGTISFRIYKNIVQAVQKTGDGHPFKEILESDLSLPQNKVEELSKVAVAHVNAAVVELRRLFLVEDLVDSIKFGVLLWCLTYLGAWFNGMTLIIIAWVALFTLPKVYETNKTQIDANLDIVRTKLEEITSKVRAAIPIGKKPEEKKQQ